MRPVCLHMIFLHYILPCPTILLRINKWTLLKEFSKEKVLFILHVMTGMLYFASDAVKYYNLWSCQKVCEALTFLLDNIYI